MELDLVSTFPLPAGTMAGFVSRGTARTPQERAARACVGPLFLLLKNGCRNVLAEHSVQLTLQLVFLSCWQAVLTQAPAQSWPIVS